MKKFRIILVVAAVFAYVKGEKPDINFPIPSIPPTSSTAKPPTTPPTTPTTTTPKPTTTTPTTTTSKPTPSPTPAPNTTTTSTEAPTTKSTPSTTTPSTTTSSPTTTTERPNPIPPKPSEPEVGTWVANYTGTNRSCVVVAFAAQFEIPYSISNKSSANSSFIGYVNVSKNATVNSSCDANPTTQKIQLNWNTTANGTNEIVLTFEKPINSTKFDLALIEAKIYPDNGKFPEINSTDWFTLYHNKAEFNTTLKRSYKCFKQQTLNLTASNSNETRGYIHIRHVQLEAFRNSTGDVFAEAEDCAPHETPDVIPIAVGCALVALILIVLAAYLIGRRRSQARGYLSM